MRRSWQLGWAMAAGLLLCLPALADKPPHREDAPRQSEARPEPRAQNNARRDERRSERREQSEARRSERREMNDERHQERRQDHRPGESMRPERAPLRREPETRPNLMRPNAPGGEFRNQPPRPTAPPTPRPGVNAPSARPTSPRSGDWLRRNMGAPPDQQKRQLEADPQFGRLPREQQQRLRERLQKFNNLPPEKRERMLHLMEWMDHLPPQKAQQLQRLNQQMHGLSPQRQQAMHQAFNSMRDLNTQQRRERIDSPEMRGQFNDGERAIMRGFVDLQIPKNAMNEGVGN